MNNFAISFEMLVFNMQKNIMPVLAILAGLWIVNFVNFALGGRLNVLGIFPRRVYGLPGIVFSPLLHGNFNHLFFNTIPLFIFLNFAMMGGMAHFYCITAVIMVLGGFGVWLLGRFAVHIGASGLIMGYMGYFLTVAYYQPTIYSVIVALVCLYYFGGILLSLFPSSVEISWEAHVLGFAAGIAANFLCPIIMLQLAQ